MASLFCQALGRGVTRSKRRAMCWIRKAAENGNVVQCRKLATRMYADHPYAREVGHVPEAGQTASSARMVEGHNMHPFILASVMHWLRKAGVNVETELAKLSKEAVEGVKYCYNAGCQVKGQVKDFKVWPQCKTARYCGDACQKQDWTTGGHKATCGTFHIDFRKASVRSCS